MLPMLSGQDPDKDHLRRVHSWLESVKSKSHMPEMYAHDRKYGRPFQIYQDILLSSNAVDFDDILVMVRAAAWLASHTLQDRRVCEGSFACVVCGTRTRCFQGLLTSMWERALLVPAASSSFSGQIRPSSLKCVRMCLDCMSMRATQGSNVPSRYFRSCRSCHSPPHNPVSTIHTLALRVPMGKAGSCIGQQSSRAQHSAQFICCSVSLSCLLANAHMHLLRKHYVLFLSLCCARC